MTLPTEAGFYMIPSKNDTMFRLADGEWELWGLNRRETTPLALRTLEAIVNGETLYPAISASFVIGELDGSNEMTPKLADWEVELLGYTPPTALPPTYRPTRSRVRKSRTT